VTVSQFTVQIA